MQDDTDEPQKAIPFKEHPYIKDRPPEKTIWMKSLDARRNAKKKAFPINVKNMRLSLISNFVGDFVTSNTTPYYLYQAKAKVTKGEYEDTLVSVSFERTLVENLILQRFTGPMKYGCEVTATGILDCVYDTKIGVPLVFVLKVHELSNFTDIDGNSLSP